MKTNNIISTPNITGNIGSCTVSPVDAKTNDSIFTSEHTVVFTNSCTGEIVKQNTYTDYTSITSISVSGIILGIIIFWFVLAIHYEDKPY